MCSLIYHFFLFQAVTMEFPSLGKRCSMDVCQQLDILPICCHFCRQSFCKTHFQPFDHLCSSNQDSLPKPSDVPHEMHVCSLPHCTTKELINMPCPFCDLHFCLHHRHQVEHNCSKLEKPVEKMVQTAELVKQIQMKNAGKKSCRGMKSDKLSAKVQLMKLKQNSIGVNELPAEERVYFLVQTPSQAKMGVFVSTLWSIGKCIDYIASACKITNFNNITGKPHLNLFTSSGDCLSENMDVTITEMVDREIVFNGQTAILKYVDQ